DNNGNLTSQTDARNTTLVFEYDALNRLTRKCAPNCSTTVLATYTYDEYDPGSGQYGRGKRTAMTDASGNSTYRFDSRGRLVAESRTVDSVQYNTAYAYDGADRPTSITYPDGEAVTQAYNGRGLPDTLSGSVAGSLVSAATYNQLGLVSQLDLGNGLRSVFGYHGLDAVDSSDNESFYGSLYRLRSYRISDGADRLHLKHWWDAAGNLAERKDVLAAETETFAYDFLDRLTSASGPYTESYSYNQVGNMLSRNGAAYAYGSSKPHAATAVGSATYSYDANGNMTDRNGTTLAWSAENALASVSDSGGAIESYVYDGDLKRVKKVAGAQTTVYVNKYYEVTNGVATKHYYHGDRLVAVSENGTLRFVHTDHLASSSVATDTSGNQAGGRTYLPFGDQRSASGTFGTNKLYTGQRLDGTGLYF
ncbi:MAG: hypothetical protein L0177_19105, partial [Chloroflexi bacterium]|nr:hypothetical protein [Chloroflexota bacterium]